jgi:hypothetical protein
MKPERGKTAPQTRVGRHSEFSVTDEYHTNSYPQQRSRDCLCHSFSDATQKSTTQGMIGYQDKGENPEMLARDRSVFTFFGV